jgi:hypothetical protein
MDGFQAVIRHRRSSGMIFDVAGVPKNLWDYIEMEIIG